MKVAALLGAAVLVLGACTGTKHLQTTPTTTTRPTTSSSSTTTIVTSSTTTASTTATTVPRPTSTTSATTEAAAPPETAPTVAFTSSVATVTAADLGASWHDGCPVGPADLRRVDVTYQGFDGAAHTGALVVNADVVDGVIDVFRQLYEAGFPIHEVKMIVTQADYDDFQTAATEGFSCREVYGGSGWSQHAYGHAIDINPVENPYVQGDTVTPEAGRAYLDRSDVRPGMVVSGGVVVAAFRSIGWGWGGSFRDYQHFSTTGT